MINNYEKLKVSVAIILQKNDKVLLFKRQNTGWADGFYTIPTGHLDKGELPKEASVREIYEEIGVKVEPENLLPVHIDFIRGKIINIIFQASKWQGEPKLMEPEKSSDLEWFNISDLPDNIAGHGKIILENIKNGVWFYEME